MECGHGVGGCAKGSLWVLGESFSYKWRRLPAPATETYLSDEGKTITMWRVTSDDAKPGGNLLPTVRMMDAKIFVCQLYVISTTSSIDSPHYESLGCYVSLCLMILLVRVLRLKMKKARSHCTNYSRYRTKKMDVLYYSICDRWKARRFRFCKGYMHKWYGITRRAPELTGVV